LGFRLLPGLALFELFLGLTRLSFLFFVVFLLLVIHRSLLLFRNGFRHAVVAEVVQELVIEGQWLVP